MRDLEFMAPSVAAIRGSGSCHRVRHLRAATASARTVTKGGMADGTRSGLRLSLPAETEVVAHLVRLAAATAIGQVAEKNGLGWVVLDVQVLR